MSFMRTINEKYVVRIIYFILTKLFIIKCRKRKISYIFFFFFTQYGVKVTKFDRKGYKRRTRLLILTSKTLYLKQVHKNKLNPKEKIPLDLIKKLEVTAGKDNFLLVKICPQYKHNKVYCIIYAPRLFTY